MAINPLNRWNKTDGEKGMHGQKQPASEQPHPTMKGSN